MGAISPSATEREPTATRRLIVTAPEPPVTARTASSGLLLPDLVDRNSAWPCADPGALLHARELLRPAARKTGQGVGFMTVNTADEIKARMQATI